MISYKCARAQNLVFCSSTFFFLYCTVLLNSDMVILWCLLLEFLSKIIFNDQYNWYIKIVSTCIDFYSK